MTVPDEFGMPPPVCPSPSRSHQGDVTSIAFDPASLRIATASLDRTARLWDVASGIPVTEPLEHGGRLSQIEFSQDGRRVVSGGRDDDTSAKVSGCSSAACSGARLVAGPRGSHQPEAGWRLIIL